MPKEITLLNKSRITAKAIVDAAKLSPTPFYIYDEESIRKRCQEMKAMPNAFGLTVRYALKANSTKALIKIIDEEGLYFDASSLNEVKRALMAGVEAKKILLTTQEVPTDQELIDIEKLILDGLEYNACSLTQLKKIAPFASREKKALGLRIHPGVGSGESVTRNTGDNYSSFGLHLSNIEEALAIIKENELHIKRIHVHIGSGGEPRAWKENIHRELSIIESYFPKVEIANFGGGFKVARMNDEENADILSLGEEMKKAIKEYEEKTGKKIHAEVEPGTYIVANAGSLVTSVMDVKRTGKEGFTFALLDGGMEVLTRPLLYGSQHPFAVLSPEGDLRFSEIHEFTQEKTESIVLVGRCCESGDSFTLNEDHSIQPRTIVKPKIGDFLIVGGTGAYASSMSPFNYNSHQQIAEVLFTNGKTRIIRKRQSLEQLTQNEL